MRGILTLAGVIAALAVAGCGGSDRTAQAATCLKNAVANAQLNGGRPGNCADSTAADATNVAGSPGVSPMHASCTHQNGDEYVCDVTGGTGGDGFYTVAYDGRTITYQAQ